ncbi:cysteine rich repeat-containing protein [Xanthobacter agilis]|uniref:Cysteine rich repeat protein n=1 Tax=Xanthobacter agilis TaxID=47492 RepID=A0ABU0L9J2_XANAG|nr:cysteine rich repeat-containing protein [Xanthobacter agilis]MDQ0503811.1 hypothetical protein [Xanthobacter agilis]
MARIRPLRPTLATICAIGALLLAAPSFAQSLADLQKACGADVKTLCAGVQPGGGRIKQCLMEKSEQISPACKSAMAAAAQARQK